ncbi:hypothetical protein DA075_06555 [Methylobacterium currus]|uniref:Uncharacterized protein n=1 Tax=Methylobacterium currus TaxID=2051553 RepID=A0A2R4WGG1_9HYPH|nr:hypothetical protein [Methylobacterium currus]AWB20625.1 hypothetical protein DA075_06555 [Methylobacterium currus]
MQTVFITRYALSMGIKEVEVVKRDEEDGWVTVKWESGLNGTAGFSKRDYSLTRDDAVVVAEKMKQRKIDSHKRSIKKLEGKKF